MTRYRHRYRRHQRKWRGVGMIIAFICRFAQIGMLAYGIGYVILQIINSINANHRASSAPYYTLDNWVVYNGITGIIGVVVVTIIVVAICQVIYTYIKDKYYW